jgi:hypothetical protein
MAVGADVTDVGTDTDASEVAVAVDIGQAMCFTYVKLSLLSIAFC